MATIPITTIFQWCGMITAASRNRITADIMSLSEGMKHLNGEKSEEMIGTFRDYARRDASDRNIIFARVQQRRLISLMDWVKDRDNREEDVSFSDGTTRQELIQELEEATTGNT